MCKQSTGVSNCVVISLLYVSGNSHRYTYWGYALALTVTFRVGLIGMMITELASHMVCQPTGCGKLLVLLLDEKVPCIAAGEDGNSQWEYYSRNAQSKLSFVTAIAICCDDQQLSLPLCHHNFVYMMQVAILSG